MSGFLAVYNVPNLATPKLSRNASSLNPRLACILRHKNKWKKLKIHQKLLFKWPNVSE